MHETQVVPRSLLYTSALDKKNFLKIKDCQADVGVIDLEDGVPYEQKELARIHTQEFYSEKHSWQTALRINPLSKREGLKDVLHIESLTHKPDIIILPMIESPIEIILFRKIFSDFNYQPKLYVTVETLPCMRVIYDIAAACDGLIFGSADYAAALGIPIGEWENVLWARCQIVAAATNACIPAFDTAYFDLHNQQGLQQECEKVISLGFSGKTAIHPTQINVINQKFTPCDAKVEQAKQIIAAEKNAGGGIARIESQMIGPPFVKLAKKILARHEELTNETSIACS